MDNVIAIGRNTIYSGENSIAIGSNSTSTGLNSVSIGRKYYTSKELKIEEFENFISKIIIDKDGDK